ncbi:MAG: ABC transporter permease, partial [Gemmatimonadaceae bacterium]
MRFLYRFLLRLFLPRSLRDTHGAEMEQLFVEQVGEARGRGLPAAVRSALGGMSDVATRAPREHWNRSGPVHSQNKEHPVQSFLIDLRQTFRSFARRPAATAAVVATLTLAVAANTTVFALLDATFRRSFPFPNAERMVSLNEKAPKWNLTFTNINYPDFVAWREKAKAFESMALYEGGSANLADANGAERLRVLRVTHDFATVLQVPLERGRMFSDSEDVPHGPNVVVIGHALWKSRFAGALDVVGKELRIDGAPHTIIGVFPPQANFPSDVAMWLPLRGNPRQQGESYSSDGIGRLRAGVTLTQAERSLLDAHASIWATKDT